VFGTPDEKLALVFDLLQLEYLEASNMWYLSNTGNYSVYVLNQAFHYLSNGLTRKINGVDIQTLCQKTNLMLSLLCLFCLFCLFSLNPLGWHSILTMKLDFLKRKLDF